MVQIFSSAMPPVCLPWEGMRPFLFSLAAECTRAAVTSLPQSLLPQALRLIRRNERI